MSIESISLIGVLTFLALILGTDLFLILVGRSAIDVLGDPTLIDTIGHINQAAGQRMTGIFVILLIGAMVLNFVTHTRTEVYLLRIGVGSLIVYAIIVLIGSVPFSNNICKALSKSSDVAEPLYQAWKLLLWPRTLAALVSFWSFLHYAMNPKL